MNSRLRDARHSAPSAAPAPRRWWSLANNRGLALDRARVLAVINVTPDSFSDGGLHETPEAALEAAQRMLAEGADMLDVGGESTRPGSEPVAAAEQIRRVIPAIRAMRSAGLDCPISVDTTRADVAQRALDAGADAVNDTSAGLDDEAMLPLLARAGAGAILMHRRAPPARDRYSHQHAQAPDYSAGGGVVSAVRAFLAQRADAALDAGVSAEAVALDPGLGFGKSVEQNFELVARIDRLSDLGYPLVAGASRKSFVGAAAGLQAPTDRDAASHAVEAALRLRGAAIIRTHEVRGAVAALRIADAIRDGGA